MMTQIKRGNLVTLKWLTKHRKAVGHGAEEG